jgi:hypothetical protein
LYALQPTTVHWLSGSESVRLTVVDPQQHGHAAKAGEQMHSELDAIQERLRALKRKLDARESLYAVDEEMASGDPVAMNPLTAEPLPPGE